MFKSKLLLAVAAVGVSTAAQAHSNHNTIRGHYVDNNYRGQVQSIRINRHGVSVDCRRDRICSGHADIRRNNGNTIRAVRHSHRAKTVFRIHKLSNRAIQVNTRIKFRDGRVRVFSDRLVRSHRHGHRNSHSHHTNHSNYRLTAPNYVRHSNYNHGHYNFHWNPVKHAAHYLLEFACAGHKCGHHYGPRKVYSTKYRYRLPKHGHNYRYRVVAVDRHGRRGHASSWRSGPRANQHRRDRHHRRNHH